MASSDNPSELTGPHGTALRIPRELYVTERSATCDAWIITAPAWHPLWSQYMLAAITLADVPGAPPAVKNHPNATHEIIVMAMDPTHGPYTPDNVTDGRDRYLTPGNIGEQFTATDEEAIDIAVLCVRAVLDGVLSPETADAPERIRAQWSQSIQRTVDHGRDPHHGGMN
jgi:hypothetical protein